MAWKAPSTLNSAISFPSTATVFPVPAAMSDAAQALTNVAMAGLLARVPRTVKLRGAATGSGAQRAPQLARQHVDGAACAAGQLLPPLALGLEALVADQLSPRRDGARDGVRVEHVVAGGADRGQHRGHHRQEGAQRRRRPDAVLAPHPRAREHARDLLEVVQEEA